MISHHCLSTTDNRTEAVAIVVSVLKSCRPTDRQEVIVTHDDGSWSVVGGSRMCV